MSRISELLLEKAASFRSKAEEIETAKTSAEPEQEQGSWSQVKQAAVAELVSKGGLEEEVASSLVNSLEEHYGKQ